MRSRDGHCRPFDDAASGTVSGDGGALVALKLLERALARNVVPAVYTEDMFRTTHDAANRAAVQAVLRADLNLVGLAFRAERKVIDKIVDGLKFHA
mgnify:CR=1 FL=1